MIKPDLFYRIVEDGRRMNIIHVTLSGGEPLLHPDMIPFLEYCHDKDLSVNVLSNLLLLDDNIIDEMRKNPLLSVQTSIYSMNPHVHDEITGIHGSLKKTKRAVQDLILAGIPVQISCPVMKEYKDTFLDVVKWGDHNNIGTAIQPQIFAQYDHTGRNLTHRLSAYEISEVVQKCWEVDTVISGFRIQKKLLADGLKIQFALFAVIYCAFLLQELFIHALDGRQMRLILLITNPCARYG